MNRTRTARRAHPTAAPDTKDQPAQGAEAATLDLGRLEGHLLQLRQQGNEPGLRAALTAVARRAGPEIAQQLAHKVEAAAPRGAGQGSSGLPPGLQRPEADPAAPQGAGQGVRGIPAELLRPSAEPPFEGVGAGVRGLPDALRRPEADAAAPQGAGQGSSGLPSELQRPEARADEQQWPPGHQGTPIKVDVHERGAERMNDHSAPRGRQGTPIKVDVRKPDAGARCEPGADPHRDANTVKDRADEAVGAAPRQQAAGQRGGGQGAAETIKNVAGAAGKGARGAGGAAGAADKAEGAGAGATDKGARAAGKGAGAATRTGAGMAASAGGAAAGEAAASATATTNAAVEGGGQSAEGDGGLVGRIKQALQIVFGAENAGIVNGARLLLSVAELYPGLGLLPGIVDRSIEFGQNITGLVSLEGDGSSVFTAQQILLGTLMGTRTFIGMQQASANQLGSMTEIIQTLALGSGVGAPVAALTTVFNEAIDVTSALLDMLSLLNDTAVLIMVEKIRANCVESDAAAIDTLEDTFTSSILGDAASWVFDLIGAASLSLTNDQNLKKVLLVVKKMVDSAGLLKDVSKSLTSVPRIAGALSKGAGILGSDGLADGTSVGRWIQDAARSTADFIGESLGMASGDASASAQVPGWLRWSQGGLQRLKQGHAAGGAAVDWAVETVNGLVEEGNKSIGELLGSKDPMGQLRDMAVEQLDRLNGELGGLTNAEGLVGDLSGGLDQASGALDEIAGRVEAIQLPELPEPEASDFGDNALADLAEGVVDAGLQQARALVQQVRQQLQQLIDGFKQQAAEKLQEVRTALDEVREFFVAYQERLAQSIGHVQETIQSITEKLGECESFEDYVDVIIEQIGEVLGFEGLSVEGLRERWDVAGGYIDEALAAVEERIREHEAQGAASEEEGGGEAFVG